jgi:hypothetical protein
MRRASPVGSDGGPFGTALFRHLQNWARRDPNATQKFRIDPSGPARNAATGPEWPVQTRDQNWDRTWDRLSAIDRDDPKSSPHKGSADRHYPTRAPPGPTTAESAKRTRRNLYKPDPRGNRRSARGLAWSRR